MLDTKIFDNHCKELLRKMKQFEKSYFCKRCKRSNCKHFRGDMNQRFRKEIDRNAMLALDLFRKAQGD